MQLSRFLHRYFNADIKTMATTVQCFKSYEKLNFLVTIILFLLITNKIRMVQLYYLHLPTIIVGNRFKYLMKRKNNQHH